MNTKKFSSIQEHEIAAALGWRVVSGSGARHTYPGDVVSEDWLGECKTHTHLTDRISFSCSVFNKLSHEAASKFKFPVLFVDDGSQKLSHTWCRLKVLPYPDYCIVPCPKIVKMNARSITFTESELRGYTQTIQPDYKYPVVYSIENSIGYIVWFPNLSQMVEVYGR